MRGWHSNEELYSALLRPLDDHEALRQRLQRFLEEKLFEGTTAGELLIALGDYHRNTNGYSFWLKPYDKFRQSQDYKNLIRRQGINDYWREFGFPDMCKPIGEDDFECR